MSENKSFFTLFGIAVLGTIVLLCSNGLTFSGITIFDSALLEEFGWTKSELKFRDFLNSISSAALMPFVGAIIDKYGAKKTIIVGLFMIAGLYYAYSYITAAWHMYAIHIGFAMAVAGASTLAVIIMVSQRIKKNRGTAIGIALAGTSLGGIVIPQIGGPLLENFGWQASFQWEALIPIGIAILIFFFLKPVKKQTEESKQAEEATEFNFKQALASPVFWAICVTGTFCFYSIMGIIANLFLYLLELGYTESEARNSFSIFFIIILCAKLCSGIVTDFINEYKLFKIQLVLMLLGTVGMAMNSEAFVWPALIAVGIGWGGLYTLLNYIIISTFGVKSAGKIGGIISVFEGVGVGLGAWLTGLISDQTGSYSASFWVVVGLLTISFITSFAIKYVTPDNDNDMPAAA